MIKDALYMQGTDNKYDIADNKVGNKAEDNNDKADNINGLVPPPPIEKQHSYWQPKASQWAHFLIKCVLMG